MTLGIQAGLITPISKEGKKQKKKEGTISNKVIIIGVHIQIISNQEVSTFLIEESEKIIKYSIPKTKNKTKKRINKQSS